MIAAQTRIDWAAVGVVVGAVLGIATLTVGAVTLAVTRHLRRLAVADSATQAAIQAAAEATKEASQASRRTSEAAYAEAQLDNERDHLWGVVECINELKPLLGGSRDADELQRASLLTAKMASYLAYLSEELQRSRYLALKENLWQNHAESVAAITPARAELQAALRFLAVERRAQ